MKVIENIARRHEELKSWRQDIHRHPETAYQEVRTSQIVAEKLEAWGLEVHRGLAQTGVVGVLKIGDSPKTIGVRADMDALDITEKNDFAYKSTHPGKMHACGHDGHTTMLLGAAQYLAETQSFNGTAYFIFQPAEEGGAGANKMVQEGLFEKFPMEAVYGMHNWPGMPVGQFGMTVGPITAANGKMDITVRGQGCHAAMPQMGTDAIVAASHIVTAMQTVASRVVDPAEAVVVSVTQIHGGETYNVIPEEVVLGGTIRTFSSEVETQTVERLSTLVPSIARAHGTEATFEYDSRYPATINTPAETEIAAQVASSIVGAENTDINFPPSMGSEDFAFLLQKKPGCYICIGNGPREGGCMLHNPRYDFNDAILPLGATYWSRLVQMVLK